MSNRLRAIAVGLIALAFILVLTNSIRTARALERAERAEGRVEGLSVALDSLRASEGRLRDSLEVIQVETQAALDSAEVVIEVTDTVLVAQMDTIEVLVQDTTALRIIEERDAVHAERMAAKDEVIEAQAEEIRVITLLDASNQQIIANLEAQNAEWEAANSDLRSAVNGLRRQRMVERGVTLAAVGVVAYRAFSGS